MPEVFTGKVLIPGDQIDDYLTALKEAEEARAPFRRSLDELNAAFAASLESLMSGGTYMSMKMRQTEGCAGCLGSSSFWCHAPVWKADSGSSPA